MKAFRSKLTALLMIAALACVNSFPQTHGGGKANIKEGLGRTWKGPSSSLMSRLLKKKTPAGPASSGAKRRSPGLVRSDALSETTNAVVTFRPGPKTGVDQALATAFASTPAEKQGLLELFAQVKQSYETEVTKEGKSNNLAAAMTFFIASNVVAYHRTDMPSDAATEDLYGTLRELMSTTTEIAGMSDADKHQMHDWLVYMGGFVLASYLDAKGRNDRGGLDTVKLLATYATQIALGIDVGKLSFSAKNFVVSSAAVSPKRVGTSPFTFAGNFEDLFPLERRSQVSRTSISSPTRMTLPGSSAIIFWPNITLPSRVR